MSLDWLAKPRERVSAEEEVDGCGELLAPLWSTGWHSCDVRSQVLLLHSYSSFSSFHINLDRASEQRLSEATKEGDAIAAPATLFIILD